MKAIEYAGVIHIPVFTKGTCGQCSLEDVCRSHKLPVDCPSWGDGEGPSYRLATVNEQIEFYEKKLNHLRTSKITVLGCGQVWKRKSDNEAVLFTNECFFISLVSGANCNWTFGFAAFCEMFYFAGMLKDAVMVKP